MKNLALLLLPLATSAAILNSRAPQGTNSDSNSSLAVLSVANCGDQNSWRIRWNYFQRSSKSKTCQDPKYPSFTRSKGKAGHCDIWAVCAGSASTYGPY